MALRHLTSIADVTSQELKNLVSRGLAHKQAFRAGKKLELANGGSLTGRTVPMMFNKRSTRTRVSTEGAVTYLGGSPMFLGKDDIQLGVNESLYDTARVISSMTAALVARVGPHSDIQGLIKGSSVPVINALCDTYHPLQAIADMITLQETFGENLKGLKVAWVGDANNVLHDLAIASAKLGVDVSAATPKEYPVRKDIVDIVEDAASKSGSKLVLTTDPVEAVKNANVIVTDTWVSMGQEEEKALRLKQFAGYQVTNELGSHAHKEWKFMHCLPRKQEEVNDEVFYSDKSLVFEEAENRLYSAIAVLEGFVIQKGDLNF